MDRTVVNMGNVLTFSSLLHDAKCEDWTFDYTSKRLTMHVKHSSDAVVKNVIFEGIYAHNMVSCDYWGASPHILGVELIAPESSSLYKQLMDEIKNMCYTNPFDDKSGECFEVRIQFTSGDVLNVLCQHVVIEGWGDQGTVS